jgi:hypothetical protein
MAVMEKPMTSSPITEIERLRDILRRVEPHLDAIVCYASTMGEHEPNRIARDVRDALAMRSSAPPVMGMEEMVETMRCKACEMAVIWEKDGGPTCACIETEWEVGRGQMPWEEGYADRAVKVLPLSTPLVTGRE